MRGLNIRVFSVILAKRVSVGGLKGYAPGQRDVIAILGAHEDGAYLVVGTTVDASMHYFIRCPSCEGKFGEVIRIREPILYKARFESASPAQSRDPGGMPPCLTDGLSNVVPLPRTDRLALGNAAFQSRRLVVGAHAGELARTGTRCVCGVVRGGGDRLKLFPSPARRGPFRTRVAAATHPYARGAWR